MQATSGSTGPVVLGYWRDTLGRTPRPDRLKQTWDACVSVERELCSPTARPLRQEEAALCVQYRQSCAAGGRHDEKSPSIRYRQGFRLKNWPFSTTLQLDDHGAIFWLF